VAVCAVRVLGRQPSGEWGGLLCCYVMLWCPFNTPASAVALGVVAFMGWAASVISPAARACQRCCSLEPARLPRGLPLAQGLSLPHWLPLPQGPSARPLPTGCRSKGVYHCTGTAHVHTPCYTGTAHLHTPCSAGGLRTVAHNSYGRCDLHSITHLSHSAVCPLSRRQCAAADGKDR
jgi:hypothetical protein